MLELAVALQGLGHRVTVVCHDFDPDTALIDSADPDSLTIKAVRTGTFDPPTTRPQLLRRQWLGMRHVAGLVPCDVDVINAHEWPASRCGRLAARQHDVPWVWTRNDDTAFERGLIPETTLFEPPSLPGRLARVAAGLPDLLDGRAADVIVVLDTRNAAAVRRAYRRSSRILRCGPPARFFNAPERTAARARLGVAADTFLAVAVGILFPHRNFEDLVRAAAGIAVEARAEVRIVGSGHADPSYADALERLIADEAAPERVRLVRGDVSDDPTSRICTLQPT